MRYNMPDNGKRKPPTVIGPALMSTVMPLSVPTVQQVMPGSQRVVKQGGN